MQTFDADDGVRLAFHLDGAGTPVVCLPGGPMQDSAYLGDLGGLTRRRRLVRLDLRGSGSSAVPADESSYRADRQVGDVEALRRHLGWEKLSLLGHSAGANLALLYLAAYPDRVAELTLVAPSLAAAGIVVAPELRVAAARTRAMEPWFPAAFAALEAQTSGGADDSAWEAVAPFAYGRWDDQARAHHRAEATQRNAQAAEHFGARGAFDPPATRARMEQCTAPVTVIAGRADLNSPLPAVRELAALFPSARLVALPRAAHFPWLDDPAAFVAAFT